MTKDIRATATREQIENDPNMTGFALVASPERKEKAKKLAEACARTQEIKRISARAMGG